MLLGELGTICVELISGNVQDVNQFIERSGDVLFIKVVFSLKFHCISVLFVVAVSVLTSVLVVGRISQSMNSSSSLHRSLLSSEIAAF